MVDGNARTPQVVGVGRRSAEQSIAGSRGVAARPSVQGSLADLTIAAGLAAVTVAFLLSFPRRLGAADEGLILYEAKRLLAGDVFFRDLFEMIPPGVQYLAAGAFALFGTTVTTARAFDATVQGLIAAGIYACCRAAGARRSLAILAALVQPVLLWPAWPYVSPHWLNTLLMVALLWVALRRPWARRPAGAAAAGAILACMALNAQQRAAIFSLALPLLLVADAWCGRRFGERVQMATVVRRIAACAVAAMVIAVPPFIVLIARAGLDAVVRALIVFPLVNYHGAIHADWGQTWLPTAPYASATFPPLLRWAPLAQLAVAAVSAARWYGRRDVAAVRTGLAIAVIGAASIASTMYFPDLIHLAFIAPVSAVAAAVAAEWSVRGPDRSRPRWRVAVPAAVLVVIGLLAWRASAVRARAWDRIAGSAATAFGQVDFDKVDVRQIALVDAITSRAAADPTRRLFCYPAFPALYLLTDTYNPTPLQIAMPGYSPADHIATAVRAVEQRSAPLVVFIPRFLAPDDPVRPVLEERYDPVAGQPLLWQLKTPAP